MRIGSGIGTGGCLNTWYGTRCQCHWGRPESSGGNPEKRACVGVKSRLINLKKGYEGRTSNL